MKINQAVLAVLSNAEIDGNAVVLSGQLDRKLYVETNRVLEAAGGKWNRAKKAHIFPLDAEGVIDQVIIAGEISTNKDGDFFPTPESLVRNMIRLANLKPGMIVLEPEAGEGGIAHIIAETNTVYCVEKHERYASKIKVSSNIFLMIRDFMGVPSFDTGAFDAVIMNPPFSKRQDIHHVNHALKFLKPDGVLVAIMSAGVSFRQEKLTTEFRSLIDQRGGQIINNPEGSFKESGTMVNTVTVVIPA